MKRSTLLLFKAALALYKEGNLNPDKDFDFMQKVYAYVHFFAMDHSLVLSLVQWSDDKYSITSYHKTWYKDTDLTVPDKFFDTIAEAYIDAFEDTLDEMDKHDKPLK